MQKITPFLWFDNQAEEAAEFYTTIFPNSKVGKTVRYDEAGAKVSGRPKGSAMTVDFVLNGQEFVALNGRSQLAMQAVLQMKKIDLAQVKQAYEQA